MVVEDLCVGVVLVLEVFLGGFGGGGEGEGERGGFFGEMDGICWLFVLVVLCGWIGLGCVNDVVG